MSILILLISFSLTGVVQEKIEQPKNYITTDLITPIFRKFTLQYERMISESDFIRFGIGYQYPKNTDSYESQNYVLLKLNNKNTVTTSYSVSAGWGRFLKPGNRFYLGGELFYSYQFYENKYYYDCAGTSSDSYVYLESEFNNVYGANFIIGYKIEIPERGKIRFVIEPYGGLGLALANIKKTTYGKSHGTCGLSYFRYYDEPVVEILNTIAPSVKIGLRIGIRF